MELTFKTISEYNDTISFKAKYKRKDNTIEFYDQTHNKINITMNDKELIIKRSGAINMLLILNDKENLGYYSTSRFEFNFFSQTKELKISSRGIYVKYRLVDNLDKNNIINDNKFWIIFH